MSVTAGGKATARAHANIALVKYWGKRAGAGNVPAAPSLSMTLDALVTETTVELGDGATDEVELDGVAAGPDAVTRVGRVLGELRARAGSTSTRMACVKSRNFFPTASGLASSASAYAALVTAAAAAYGVELSPEDASRLARKGSASAARSIHGGWVLLPGGDEAGPDPAAEPLAPPDALDVAMVVAITDPGPKKVSSRDGMTLTAETSPYYQPWLATARADAAAARAALAARELPRLGELMEQSCLAMHASALAARPGVIYLRGVTLDGFLLVRELRRGGRSCWFTADAGPHVKALCARADAAQVAAALGALPGVTRTLVSAPGGKAHLV
ncbi:MAG: diphosphomevalonate decarboxylase [Deltaproteobacteria bacterium]|nr:diphosphomevalonate decarboxylase [Deltaproteobacteria bacterium]